MSLVLHRPKKRKTYYSLLAVVICFVLVFIVASINLAILKARTELVNEKTKHIERRKHRERTEKLFTYKLVKNEIQNIYARFVGPCGDDHVLPTSLQKKGIFDFNALVETNLRILFVGDSVAVQLSQIFQESSSPKDRHVVRFARGEHESTHVALTHEGGRISGLRVNGLPCENDVDDLELMAPLRGGGFSSYDIHELRRLNYLWRDNIESLDRDEKRQSYDCHDIWQQLNSTNTALRLALPNIDADKCREEGFDVIVNTLSPGWIDLRRYGSQWQLMKDNLNETIRLSFDVFDAETVVLQTIPVMNNLKNIPDVKELNKYIWELAKDFNKSNENIISYFRDGRRKFKRILVMDMYAFSIHLFLQNSIQVGLISVEHGDKIQQKLNAATSYNDFIEESQVLDFIMKNTTDECFDKRKTICKKVGHVCLDSKCTISSAITSDGIHYCTGKTGGRMNAGLACLIDCRYSSEGSDSQYLNKCMFACNKEFLSIEPID